MNTLTESADLATDRVARNAAAVAAGTDHLATVDYAAFRLEALDPALFARWFDLSDDELARHGMRRVTADAAHGFPCRVSLEDAAVGDELLLLSHEHQPAATSPYRAGGPIFVRRGVRQAFPAVGELPPVVLSRLMSVRAYDAAHEIVDAEVCEGHALRPLLARLFAREDVAYAHLHHARQGCFSCAVRRA